MYPAYMPGTSQGGGTHTLWGPPLCEVPNIYAGYRIYKILFQTLRFFFNLFYINLKDLLYFFYQMSSDTLFLSIFLVGYAYAIHGAPTKFCWLFQTLGFFSQPSMQEFFLLLLFFFYIGINPNVLNSISVTVLDWLLEWNILVPMCTGISL